MMNEEYSFTVINKEGIEVTCDVLSMITDEKSNIYLLYTDYLLDSKGNFRLLASQLVQEKKDFVLKDIDDELKLSELIKAARNLYQRTVNA
jgi:uncharacterized protein YrzB (UPF0473 family)